MNRALQSLRARNLICDQFEKEWSGNKSLCVEQFLEQHQQLKDETIDELIVMEIDLRYASGVDLDPKLYQQRFPHHQSAIELGFDRISTLENTRVTRIIGDDRPQVEATTTLEIPTNVGDYKIIRRVGIGAFGVVYKAQKRNTKQVFALKFPRQQSLMSVAELNQLKNEAELVKDLQHPAIVQSYGLHFANDFPFVVQQFVDGQTLNQYQFEDLREIIQVVASIANGLAFAHLNGLTHRDLKPDNILMDRSGQPLIADFGLSIHEDLQRSLRGQLCGSPPYMSPEQVEGRTHQLDGRSDIWSLGVVLYQLITNRRPFDGPTQEIIFEEITTRSVKPPRMVKPDLDHELQRICLKCLSKPIHERYDTADQLAEDLQTWLDYQHQWQSQGNPPLIPRGLRSFEAQDSQAYLELLPGERDQFNIPDCVQFWKRKLESNNTEHEFAVGVVVGPNGSGKSSFIKAGLLPQLDPNLVKSIYLDASSTNTEYRLLNSIKNAFPQVPGEESLPSTLDGLKNNTWSTGDRKTLIVVDQFEQWLLANRDFSSSPLARALDHCDGSKLFCMLLVRENFSSSANRFLNELGQTWNENGNILRFGSVEPAHARKVLHRIGCAFSKLPMDDKQLKPANNKFLDTVVSALSDRGRILYVHLTTIAETMKSRPWTISEWKSQNGVHGIAERFLYEIFSQSSPPAKHHNLQASAHAVLNSLIPEHSVDSQIPCQSSQQLVDASANHSRPDQFQRLMHVLDQELRIVGAVDRVPEAHDGQPIDTELFQLTDDCLVPAVRNWLNAKFQTSWKGRTQLRLRELANQWSAKKESRFLPSLFEYLSIVPNTWQQKLSNREKNLMRVAGLRHLSRIVAIVGLVICTWIFVLWYRNTTQTNLAVEKILHGKAGEVPGHLESLDQLSNSLPTSLRSFLDSQNGQERLRAALAQVHLSPENTTYDNLLAQIEIADSVEIDNVIYVSRQVDSQDRIEVIRDQFEGTKSLKLKARLASLAASLDHDGLAREMLSCSTDPTTRAAFVNEFAKWHGDPSCLKTLIESGNPDVCYGALQALAEVVNSVANKGDWEDFIRKFCSNDFDSGIQLTAELVIRRMGFTLEQSLFSPTPIGNRELWRIKLAEQFPSAFIEIEGGILKRSTGLPEGKRRDQYPLDQVKIAPLYISSTKVPISLFKQFISELPKEHLTREYFEQVDWWEAADEKLPVTRVRWNDAIEFLNWLNRKHNFDPCYRKVNSEMGPSWEPIPNRTGFRLPTINEMEYVCRAGTETRVFWGTNMASEVIDRYCFLAATDAPKSASRKDEFCPCGTLLPNRWGLQGTLGNTWEICENSKGDVPLIYSNFGCPNVTAVRDLFSSSFVEMSKFPTPRGNRYTGLRIAFSIAEEDDQ